ncbi:MAG: MmcQ/YjbR family DNA-binding protein [Actinobacteria bacterium]|nr:MmcQ/YjbR family DNA-binding protein [Actinomycetota bacterium]
MAEWSDVERVAGGLPEADESTSFGNRAFKVRGKTFAWDRPLRKKELAELGDAAPGGPVLGVRLADQVAKQAVLAEHESAFTVDHFRNFDAVLIELDHIDVDTLGELIEDAWASQAPPRLVADFEANNQD